MTSFALAAANPASVFYKALDRWCGRTLDSQTLKLLEAGGRRSSVPLSPGIGAPILPNLELFRCTKAGQVLERLV
jgi:hypothetical protein